MSDFEKMIDNFINNFQFPAIKKQDIEEVRKEILEGPEIKNLNNEIEQLKAIQSVFL